jgi:glutathione S-transferase
MKLYFSPLACSLATRIAFYEAGAAGVTYVEVDSRTKRLPHGGDFRAIHPLGLVPTLELDDGDVLTEGAAILQLVADLYPDARLAPRDARDRTRLHQWLCFIGTELHKSVYAPLLDKSAPAAVKAYALAKAEARLAWLAARLGGRSFLLDHFTVADAYLFAILNWSAVTPVDLAPWPAIRAYHAGLHQRPSVARAFADERELYVKERARERQAGKPEGAADADHST